MTLRCVSLLVLLSTFALAGVGRADDAPVAGLHDDADLFSAEARQKAGEALAEIRDVYHLDFVIETVNAPPEDMRKQVAGMKTAAAVQYFKSWGAQRAEAEGVHGVHVLICVDPGYVQVTLPADSTAQSFTAYDARRLQSRLKSMKKGPEHVQQRDAKLLAALAQVRVELGYNLRPPFPWLAVGGAIAGALGLWGVLGVVRMRLHGGSPPTGGIAEPRPLALFNGMLSGMFGSVAGHWIYDTLFISASGSGAAKTAAPVEPAPIAAAAPAADAIQSDALTPEQAKAERMDLAARDYPTEEEPIATEPTRK